MKIIYHIYADIFDEVDVNACDYVEALTNILQVEFKGAEVIIQLAGNPKRAGLLEATGLDFDKTEERILELDSALWQHWAYGAKLPFDWPTVEV